MMNMLDVKRSAIEDSDVSRRPAIPPDAVDRRMQQWQEEIPRLDPGVEGIIQRVGKLERTFKRLYEETLDAYGLTWGEWKVITSLRYAGAPYRSSPSKLSDECDLSTGAMTARLDKMEAAGTVRRLPDPDDRRGVVIELTDEGHALWQEVIDLEIEKESNVATALTGAERDELNALLRRLVHAFEPLDPPGKS